jgi:hypothetical protein
VAMGAGSGSWGELANSALIANRTVFNTLQNIKDAATNDYAVDRYYQLDDYTEFWVSSPEDNPITLDYGIRLGINSILNGASPNLATLLAGYADLGSDLLNSMVQVVGVNCFINSVKLLGQGPTSHTRGLYCRSLYTSVGRLYVLDDFVMDEHIVAADVDVGPQGLFSGEGTTVLSCGSGWIFKDIVQNVSFGSGTVNFSQGFYSSITGVCIDLTDLSSGGGTPGFLASRMIAIIPPTGSFISTTVDGGDILTSALGEVKDCRVIFAGPGGTFWEGSETQNDLKWEVKDNTGVDSTITAGEFSSDAGAVTTVSSSGVEYKITGNTTYSNSVLKRFDDNSGAENELRYINEPSIFGYLSAVVVGQASGGGTNTYKFCITKDFGGSPVEVACVAGLELSTSVDIPIPLLGFSQIEEDDVFTLTVTNETGTNNFTMSSMKLDIIKVS